MKHLRDLRNYIAELADVEDVPARRRTPRLTTAPMDDRWNHFGQQRSGTMGTRIRLISLTWGTPCPFAQIVRTVPKSALLPTLMIVTSALATPCLPGQEAPVSPSRALYPLPRYDEDWRELADPSTRNDLWDPVKFVPLSENGTVFLSFGGEARVTYERFHNTNFGLSPQDADGYYLQRYLLHMDFHKGERFRFFGELSSSLEYGRTGGPRPVIDEDQLDVHQGFLDVLLTEPGGDSSLSLRVGRQELALGSGRMVALREGPNVPSSFDGMRATVRLAGWQVDAFATRSVQSNPGIFDDPPAHDFAFWGAYATHRLSPAKGKPALDVYYLGLDRKRVVYNQGAGQERRHTLGTRLWGQRGQWIYDAEAMYQFGQFGSGRIDAWRLAADNAYTFPSAHWRPRVGFTADIASGDKNPRTQNLQTFNSLFQSGTYSGRALLLGPYNAIRLEPSIGLLFSEHLTLSAGWGFYWRESSNDGLYGIPGNLLVPSNGVKSRYEGDRPTVELDWQLTRHLSAHVSYIYVFNAQFEEQSVHATASMSYISPWVTYRF